MPLALISTKSDTRTPSDTAASNPPPMVEKDVTVGWHITEVKGFANREPTAATWRVLRTWFALCAPTVEAPEAQPVLGPTASMLVNLDATELGLT